MHVFKVRIKQNLNGVQIYRINLFDISLINMYLNFFQEIPDTPLLPSRILIYLRFSGRDFQAFPPQAAPKQSFISFPFIYLVGPIGIVRQGLTHGVITYGTAAEISRSSLESQCYPRARALCQWQGELAQFSIVIKQRRGLLSTLSLIADLKMSS